MSDEFHIKADGSWEFKGDIAGATKLISALWPKASTMTMTVTGLS